MGKKYPMLKTRQVIRVLTLLGFIQRRQTGSHIIFQHADGRATVVPQHAGQDIGRGLLHKILQEIEIDPEPFFDYV